MNNRYDAPPAQSYRPEKPNHVKTGVRALFFMMIYHVISWIFYSFLMSPLENQMVGDEHEPAYRFVMFGFSLLTLILFAVIMTIFYLKNGARKRAFLAATSVEIRGAENIAEGAARYRKLALTEAIISTAVSAAVWLIPAVFYTAALSSSGMGYGYAEAWGIEKFFVGAMGFFQPFQNALVGMLVGMGTLFCFHWFGRLYAHKCWQKNRIRR